MPQKDRLSRLFENSREDLDVIVIANGDHPDPNFFYVSGLRSGLFEGNMLFLFPDRHVEILTNPLEETAARQKKEFTVHIDRGRDPSARKRIVSSVLKGRNRVGLNFAGVSHKDYERLRSLLKGKRLFDVSEALARSRLVKDKDELETLSKAAKIISTVVDEVPETAEEGMTERALKAQIDYRMVEEGADGPSFESIVAFGENSAIPHHSSGERRLRGGDNILVDVGARYRLYCSDLTRTFFMGRAAQNQKDAYAKVLEAQTAAMDAIKDGVYGSTVHKIAARVIDQSKFKGRFTHGLGHSLGLEVHDGPGLALRKAPTLRENMVMTVEPGIYVLGEGGVRVEDDVVVTRRSCEPLTSSSKELTEI